VGVVVSAKQPHTVTVVVERMREHPLYKKVIRLRKKFAAHDAAGDVRAGDLVRIQESRPFSATKHWQVVEVLSRAGEAGAAAPRVADVEQLLEQAEGVTDLLVRPREEKVAAADEETAE
jgi:small subunit ribosomal protein S17